MTEPGTSSDTEWCGENERLYHELVELRAPHIGSTADSAGDYDKLHDKGHLRQRDSFYKWLLSLLQTHPGQSILDVSSGQGALLRFASQAGMQSFGIDLSAPAVLTAAQEVTSARLCLANAEQLPYRDSTFDVISNIGSIEHYFRPGYAVREMARVLHPDGLALIMLPNTFGLLGNILHVWRKGDVYDDGQPLQRYGTYSQWRRLLEINGLQVVRATKYEREWPQTWPDLRWNLLHPHKLVRAILTPFIPLNLSSFLVYLCQKVY